MYWLIRYHFNYRKFYAFGLSLNPIIEAAKISDKRGEQYAHVMGFIRTRLCFYLLRSVLKAVRGVRGKSVKEALVGFIPFNIIPSCESYDC